MSESSEQNATSVIVEKLRGWNAKAVSEVIEFHGETTVVVPRELLRANRRAMVRGPFAYLRSRRQGARL